MQPGLFATGGYDHLVHLWSFSPNKPPKTTGPLTIKHSSLVQSMLAIRDTSHKLLTASADCSVSVFDLASERVVNTLKLSNSIYHVHPALSEFCNLLEVAHRELQFEVRDHRLVPTTPVVRFGFSSTRLHGRFVRGAMQGTTFMSGGSEKDGCVRLWDLRKTTDVMKTVPCLPGRKVIQVAFGNEEMVACSEDHHLAFMNRIGDLAEGAAP
ncbi:WD40-repeat-containing domain protein [Trametes maxima]|nr:WD40-repeat-containing domain protein [Trametes maxima]